MFKVVIKRNFLIDQWYFDSKSMNEMKDWCRETFGKNKRNQSPIWRSGTESHWNELDEDDEFYKYDDEEQYPVFYFNSEEHASWFKMRWS